MADNTKQYLWIVLIKEGLELLFQPNPNIFIAADLLWYPVAGNNRVATAPDVMVVWGRPKGHRSSCLEKRSRFFVLTVSHLSTMLKWLTSANKSDSGLNTCDRKALI